MDPFLRLARALRRSGVRFVVIGLSGINLHARSASEVFATQDRDLFVPPHPDEDRFLAERVIANRALVRATDAAGLDVDFTLVMAGFDFETVWNERRTFRVEGVEIPVARLAHIIESKRRAGRDKDRLFFATHAEAIRDLLRSERDDSPGSPGPGGKRPGRRRSRKPRRGR